MEEEELLSLLRGRFEDQVIDKGLRLADGGVKLEKDHRMVRQENGTMGFNDFAAASISKSETKVEFSMDSTKPGCKACPQPPGTICPHVVATIIAANRQGFLADEQLKNIVSSLSTINERGASAARRVCPNCGQPLDINSQKICPECGRGVCPDCYRSEDSLCTKCYKIKVLGEKPEADLLGSIKNFFSRFGS